jgi:hypothetical protein
VRVFGDGIAAAAAYDRAPRQETPVRIAVQVEPADTTPSAVDYRWDPDTDILSAHIGAPVTGTGMSGSVGLEGNDGSWLILDVMDGRINAVEVAVWPDVRRVATLTPPEAVPNVSLRVPSRASQPKMAALEIDTRMVADADPQERNFHFRLGAPSAARTLRVANDVLVDVDADSHMTGLWLLNVPPCPGAAP